MPDAPFTISYPAGKGSLLIQFKELPNTGKGRAYLLSSLLKLLFFIPPLVVVVIGTVLLEEEKYVVLANTILAGGFVTSIIAFLGYMRVFRRLEQPIEEEIEVEQGILEVRRSNPLHVVLRGQAGDVRVYRSKYRSGWPRICELRISTGRDDTAIAFGCTDQQLDRLYAEISAALNHHAPESAASDADAA